MLSCLFSYSKQVAASMVASAKPGFSNLCSRCVPLCRQWSLLRYVCGCSVHNRMFLLVARILGRTCGLYVLAQACFSKFCHFVFLIRVILADHGRLKFGSAFLDVFFSSYSAYQVVGICHLRQGSWKVPTHRSDRDNTPIPLACGCVCVRVCVCTCVWVCAACARMCSGVCFCCDPH